jgi:hypothetical protein
MQEVFQIGYYTGMGMSGRQIATLVHRNQSTICRTIQKYSPEAQIQTTYVQTRIPEFRAPAKFKRTDHYLFSDPLFETKVLRRHYLIYLLLKEPLLSLRHISEMMEARNFPFAVGKTQIANDLSDMHIRSIRQIPKPWMTIVNREYRNRFAEEIQTDFRMLLPWLFTAEASIILNGPRLNVWGIPGMLDRENVYTDRQQFPMRIMVWGGIARNYKSPLIRVEGNLNADRYIELVNASGVITMMNSQFGSNAWVFQDDGASAHRAKKARAFLAQHCFTLSTDLHWPAHSPDLNVIENMWGILKDKMIISNCKTPDDLWNEAKRVWDAIPIEVVNKLIDSFHLRLRAVAALDGKSLNGHQKVQSMLKGGHSVPEIREMMKEENRLLQRFLEESQSLFELESWKIDNLTDRTVSSFEIIELLPEAIRQKVRLMIPQNWHEWYRF